LLKDTSTCNYGGERGWNRGPCGVHELQPTRIKLTCWTRPTETSAVVFSGPIFTLLKLYFGLHQLPSEALISLAAKLCRRAAFTWKRAASCSSLRNPETKNLIVTVEPPAITTRLCSSTRSRPELLGHKWAFKLNLECPQVKVSGLH